MLNYTPRRKFSIKKSQLLLVALLLLLAGGATVGYYRYSRPISSASVQEVFQLQPTETTPDIHWPLAQASIGTVEDGVLASKPNQTPKPTASTAKLITVLTVLEEKPLALGEQGPLLTIDQNDMALYDMYYRAGGSLVAVELGEQLTQYQMMQGILIRSGNNLADSLAIWAFGSLGEYQKAAQKYVDKLGMSHTTVGTDASGLSTTTTSTAEDLVRLGIAAMKHEVVREIVRQPTSNLPVDGSKPSTNWMLGQSGVVGIKTGNIPAVGGVFVIASEYAPEGKEPITIVGAVQGASTTASAISQASQLAESIKPLFVAKNIIKKGTVVAHITTPWGESSDVVAAEDVTVFGWKYSADKPIVALSSAVPFEKGATLGTISVGEHSSDLIATGTIRQPSWWWRIKTSR